MSGILRRTAMAEVRKNGGIDYIKFWDWSKVDTAIGSMWEPTPVNQRNSMGSSQKVAQWQPEDDMAMINEILIANWDNHKSLMGEDGVIGNWTQPRSHK